MGQQKTNSQKGPKLQKQGQPARGKQQAKAVRTASAPVPELAKPLFNLSFRVKAWILMGIGGLLYLNSLGNQFALDDGIVIIHNQYVLDGFSGIWKILTRDAYDSWYQYMHAGQMLAGGRYRPLSIVVFAIEQQFFGQSWFIKHLGNVLFYMLCIYTIYYFLRNQLLKNISFGEDCAFIATLLFAIHPMHTEVVDNVKSLDEILSLTLIMSTFIYSLKYFESKEKKHLIAGIVSYFLALLAKEYAVTLIFLLPLLFYVAGNKNISGALTASLPYLGVLFIYMLVRKAAVGLSTSAPGGEILNNPYLVATHSQQLATEWYVLGKYAFMLFFPYPLSSDYSYNVIPYHTFTDPTVILSILLYIGMGLWGIRLIVRRDALAVPVFFYLANLAMVSNFVLFIGASMGERLIFHSSFGFAVIVAYYLLHFTSKMKLNARRALFIALFIPVIGLCSAEIIKRNPEWKSDQTLFLTDIHTVPNSIMVNGNAGARYVDMADRTQDSVQRRIYLDSARFCLIKSIILHKNSAYVTSYLNLGICYTKLLMPDSAAYCFQTVLENFPHYPNIDAYYEGLVGAYSTIAHRYAAKGDFRDAVGALIRGTRVMPENADIWDNLGGAYFTAHNYDSAKYAWGVTLKLNPTHPDALKGLSAIQELKQVKN